MDLIHLRVIASDDAHPRADGGAIALRSNQFDLDPVLLVAAIVAQQGRDVIHVQDQCVDVAIVVEVAESGAAAGKALVDARTQF